MKFVASRLSEGNKLFPAEIHIEETGVNIKAPGFFNNKSQFLAYEHISSIEIETPLIGFSTLKLSHGRSSVFAHGFTKSDVKAIKKAIDEGKSKNKKGLYS